MTTTNTATTPTGRLRPPHLLKDDFHVCAQRIYERLASRYGRFLAYVDATGHVRAAPYTGNPLQEERIACGAVIGMYTQDVQLNEIEDDVLVQVRAALAGAA